MNQIRLGQGLLIICCAFYLVWWCAAFHPSHGNSHASGIDGILLLITAIFGLSGLAVNLIGLRDSGARGAVSGWVILVSGLAVYLVLMLLTGSILHRQVTTELLLIIGWVMLEFASVNAAYAFGRIIGWPLMILLAMIVIAGILSLVFYLLYYDVSPMTGYYFGMVPLVMEAACMITFEGMVGLR